MFTKNVRLHSNFGRRTTKVTASATCSSSVSHQDIDNLNPLDSPTGPSQTEKPNLAFCSFGGFKKYAKTSPFSVIHIKPNLSTLVLAASQPPLNSSTDSPIPPKPDPSSSSDFDKYVPSKYSDFEDVFSTPSGSSTLPPHQPGTDLWIDIEPGKSPPWGPMYSMSTAECATVVKYIEDKLAKGQI